MHIKMHVNANTGDNNRNAIADNMISRNRLMWGLYCINLGKYFADRLYYPIYILISHFGINGQAYRTLVTI